MGGPSQTTTIPPPTAQDIELQNLNVAAAQKQSLGQSYQYAQARPDLALQYLDAVKSGGTVPPGLQTMFGGLESFDTDAFRTQLQQQQQVVQQQAQLQDLTTKQALKYAQGDFSLTPQEQASVDQAFAGPEAQANYDLKNAMMGNASARGLNLSDSPIANEYGRQQRLLGQQFGSARASTALNLGLAQENANLAYSQFTAGLSPGSYNTFQGAQGYQSPNLASGLNLGLQTRMGQPSVGSTYGGLSYLGAGAGIAQGAGSAMYGYGSIGRGLAANSAVADPLAGYYSGEAIAGYGAADAGLWAGLGTALETAGPELAVLAV